MRVWRKLIWAGVVVVSCTSSVLTREARAQSESGAAAVEGAIVDPDGKGIPGAAVTIRNVETGYSRSVTTDATGHFRAAAMPVATYVIDAKADGFALLHQAGVELRVGQTEHLTLALTVAPVTEEVTVSATPRRLDTTAPAASTSIPQKAIDDLPVRGRNFAEFAQLSPTILQESDRSGMIISGQRSINSNVSIDGTDFNDPLQGNQRGGNEAVFFFPQSAVREFQVVRSGVGAEVGRTSAGFVNVVTKSGANQSHGDAFYFNRNRGLTSADAFDQKLNNQQNQFGGSSGGALAPDRAFYFGAFEQNFLRVPFVVRFQQQAAGVIVPDHLRALEGEKRGTNNPTSLFGRVDMNVTKAETLNVQYTFSRLRGENFNFDSPQQDVAETANYTRKNRSNGVKAGWQSILGPATVNEIRGQVATDNRDEAPNALVPQIVITGFGTLGSDTGRPRTFNNTRTQMSDNLTAMRGRHQLRVGADLNVTRAEQRRESNILGRFDYRSLADYVAGRINRYRQTVPGFDPADLLYAGTQKEFGLYAQDAIALHDVTLTAGLRWDAQWNPQPTRPNPLVSYSSLIPNDLKMWQPRLGAAWNVTGTNRTVVRVSSGMYDARTPANLFQRVFTDNGISAVAVDSRTDASVLTAVPNGQSLTLLPSGVRIPPQRVFGFDPLFTNPRTLQAAATLEQQLGGGMIMTAGYVSAGSWNLQRRLDRNLFPPTYTAAGNPIYPTTRPNPAFAQLEVNESTATSRYHAVALTAAQRTHRTFIQANYTWALNKDDDSNERNFSREVTLDVFNTAAEYTYSKQDVRHNVNVSAIVDLRGGWTAGAILIARTGMPYTAVVGSDQQNDANDDNDRAIINDRVSERNAFRQPTFFNLDLRLMKALSVGRDRIDLIVDVFNATRASNKHFGNDAISVFGTTASPVATAGQPLFAPSTARFGGPRQVQLGARVTF
jgi:hypothetical protein